MKKFKKTLSMLLALAMVMTSLTVTAFGADPTWKSVKGSDAITKLVAGQTYYFKLSGATYTGSTVGAIIIPEGAEVHIDINGQRFYTNNTGRSHIINKGTLYITNSAGVDKGEIIGNSNNSYPVINNDKGTLSISDCLVAQGSGGKGPHNSTAATTNGIGAIKNTGTLSMENCIICSKIVNTGTITPIADGYYFDDMSKYVAEGCACVDDTSTYTCRYVVYDTTVAIVTVNGIKTKYIDIEEAKTAVETASGTVTYEIIDNCGEDPLTWRNDLVAMADHESESVYSNDLSKIIDKAKSLTSDGSTVDITLLDDCTISSSMDFFDEWSETIKRTINFDLNGFNITSASGTGSIFGMAEQGYLNIIDSVGGSVINANGRYLLYIPGYSSVTKVYGGSFIGLSKLRGTYCNEGQLNFYGGTYNIDPSDYVTDKTYYAYPNSDETFTVKQKIFAVESAGKTSYYPFASEALSAILASESKTGSIRIDEDTQLDDTLLINDKNADITINLGGCIISPANGKAFADLQAGALTINNGTIDFTGCGEEADILVGEGLLLEANEVEFTGAEIFIKSKGTVLVDGVPVTSGIVLQEKSGFSFNSIQAVISDEISFNFVVNAALTATDASKKIKLQYTIDTLEDGVAGRSTITLEPVKSENAQYTFEFTKKVPQWSVNSDLELKVLLDDEVKLERGYTVQDYYNTLNANYPDHTLLNTVMANQLKFAEELQKIEFGASTIEYAGWEDEFISVAEPTEEDDVKATVDKSGLRKDVAQILAASVNVLDRMALVYNVCYPTTGATVSVVDSHGTPVSVEGADVEASTKDSPWRVEQSRLSPLDYGEKYTITLADGDGKTVHAITYSVNSYCYSLINNETSTQQVKDIALALYRYGIAAAAFATESAPDANHYTEPTYKWAPYYVSCTATRKCVETGEIQTETAEAYKTVTKEAVDNLAEEYTMTARFVNPAFRTQIHEAYPDPKALTPKEQQNPQNIAYEKHLILNADGSYGGTLNKSLYGEGTPQNGALDQVDADGNYTSVYYAVNDYYNLKSTATRVILPKFQSYQQTMQYSDGIACALMALNYMGEDVADKYTEENLVKKYEAVNKTTVKGNGTTQEGLAAMLTAEGFNAVANDYKSSGLSFNAWVKDRVTKGQIVMGYFHMDRQERWMAIIGYDDMGTSATGDDIFIFANPYDVWDHYQDGYYNGGAPWMYAVDLAGTMTRQNESVAIIPKNPVSLEYDYDNDPVLCYPSMGERHLLYNLDGTWGGAVNEAVYGGGGTQNGQVPYDDGYRSREHFEYNYYAFPDIYNMQPDKANGLHVLPGWSSFEQTMASSCGISSTLNTLNYLGYDFSELSYVLKQIMTKYKIDGPEDLKVPTDYDILQNIVNGIEKGDHSKVQEAIVAIYSLNDDYFSSHTSTEVARDGYLDIHGLKGFNNYGGVGAGNLHNVPLELGFADTEFGRYYSSTFKSKGEECMPFPTYESFLEFAIENLDKGQPIIFCGPNHWRVIIGIDTMGTKDTRDDIIFLGDSSDGWDHFQNGVDTEPARTWYAKWYNGGKNTNQQYILIK